MSNLIIAPQIDILNPYSAAQVRLSRTNEQLTAITNLLNRRNLYESVAWAYCNILSYQWQMEVTKSSLANADTLVRILPTVSYCVSAQPSLPIQLGTENGTR